MILSIIIPVHNCEKYIADCIDSCLSQNIPASEYEIICIDDCSTDNSYYIISKYAEKYNNIVVLQHEKNFGVSAARNAGIDVMRGEYCCFLDGDDFIADNCLEKIVQRLDSGCEMLSVGQATFHNEDNRERHYYVDKINYNGVGLAGYITNRILKTSLIKNLRFQTNVAYGEDEIFFFEIMRQKPIIEEYDYPVYYYRLHTESAMSLDTEKRLKRIASVERSADYMVKKYTYDDVEAARFINQRISIALADIAMLSILQRFRELQTLNRIITEVHIPIDKRVLKYEYLNIRKSIVYRFLNKNNLFRTVYHAIRGRR